tara:strand:- start:5072 stop:6613 length:1542 start_codon:yes stop_codon:yes gene_type:complete
MQDDSQQDPNTPQTISYDTASIVEGCKADINILGAVAMPDIVTAPYPPTFTSIANRLKKAFRASRDFSKLCIGLPRGHGKTVFIKIMVMYAILFTPKKFILVIAAVQTRADAIISDIEATLKTPNMVKLFGYPEFSKNTQDQKIMHYRGRDIILVSSGALSSKVRGLNIKNVRPDIMIFDDAQSELVAQSITQAEQFIGWFNGTALKAKAPNGCTFVYIGNMYPDLVVKQISKHKSIHACQLRNLQFNPSWESIVTGAILADDTALWEEVQPLEQLLSELEDDISAGTEARFWAEVMNDPSARATNGFDFNKVPVNIFEGDTPQGRFAVVDPSLGRSTSDALQITLFEVFDGTIVIDKTIQFKGSAPQLVHFLIDLSIEENVPLVAVESYAYQATLVEWVAHICEQRAYEGLTVVPVHRGTTSKNSAIMRVLPAIQEGDIILSDHVRSITFSQIRSFNPMKTDNRDDLLDTIVYAPMVLRDHWQDIMLPLTVEYDNYHSNRNSHKLIIPKGDY